MGMDRKIKKKKWPPKKIASIAAVAIFVFVMVYLFVFKLSKSTLNVKRERLTISTIVRGPYQEFIPIMGNVEPIYTFFLDAEEGGRVEEIYVEAGAMVKKDDPQSTKDLQGVHQPFVIPTAQQYKGPDGSGTSNLFLTSWKASRITCS